MVYEYIRLTIPDTDFSYHRFRLAKHMELLQLLLIHLVNTVTRISDYRWGLDCDWIY
jgi:hypothetical protein